MTAQENSDQLRHSQGLARALSRVIGARMVNMLFRKLEEIRLSLWVEGEMRARFGSRRRAKEEIPARYTSLIYMGNGQYGFAKAAEYYFGRPRGTLNADDADKAALLAGAVKSARGQPQRVLQRRNQILPLRADRHCQHPGEDAQSGDKQAAALLRHHGLGGVRSDLAGACQRVRHHRIGHSHPASCDPRDRLGFRRGASQAQVPVVSG